jgi:Protein of unknown function (DUF2911)
MRSAVALCCAGLLLAASVAYPQQDKSKRPSPPASASCDLGGGKTLKVDYSSPRAKGRKIFGGVVPYGEVWRTGANEATSFVTDADLKVGGTDVPAGSYTIFTIPAQNRWTLIISKKTGEWGTNYAGASQDLARIEMKTGKTSAPVEDFTISFEKGTSGCAMRVEWENTQATVDIARK